MKHSLHDMIAAFERTSMDDKICLIMRSEEDLEVCIEFNREDQFRCWNFYYKEAQQESRQRCSRSHAVDIARAFQLSESALAKELAGHLLTQAAFADQFVREIQELLGEAAVRESIMSTQLFMDALKEAVASTLEQPLASAVTPSTQEQHSEALLPPAEQPLKLRVIKGT
jgi:hypothetical protein